MSVRWLMSSSRGFTLTISADLFRPNLRTIADAAGYDGVSEATITVATGVIIAGASAGTWPAGKLTLVNNGVIGGEPNGGTALNVTSQIKITNNGMIVGGGGYGGHGEGATYYQGSGGGSTFSAEGGEGGAGAGYFWNSTTQKINLATYQPGTNGQYRVYGGAVSGGQTPGWIQAGNGGSGGALGEIGGGGSPHIAGGDCTLQSTFGRSSGQVAGYYVLGNSNVTWLVTGTRSGNVG